jgi:hypothetical protein
LEKRIEIIADIEPKFRALLSQKNTGDGEITAREALINSDEDEVTFAIEACVIKTHLENNDFIKAAEFFMFLRDVSTSK